MQLDLIEWSATQRRDAALAQVEANGQEWMDLAMIELPNAVRVLPEPFIPEQIKLAMVPRIGKPHHFNCWGALIRKAIKTGIIERTGGTGHSQLPGSHGTEAPFYRRCQ